jgi:phage-related protein
MARTQAVFYRNRDGNEPVDTFIDSVRPPAAQVAIDNAIDLLNGLNPSAPPLAFPHSSQLVGELRELRAHYGRTHYRILYRRSGNLFVLLHALTKRARAVPPSDMRIAQERFRDFKARMSALHRVPPRAAGRDAPRAPRRSGG